ncbi:unnamed protein product [Caenorhabditis nigoni]
MCCVNPGRSSGAVGSARCLNMNCCSLSQWENSKYSPQSDGDALRSLARGVGPRLDSSAPFGRISVVGFGDLLHLSAFGGMNVFEELKAPATENRDKNAPTSKNLWRLFERYELKKNFRTQDPVHASTLALLRTGAHRGDSEAMKVLKSLEAPGDITTDHPEEVFALLEKMEQDAPEKTFLQIGKQTSSMTTFPGLGEHTIRRAYYTNEAATKFWEQYPVRVAEASTIQKSQGLTVDGVLLVTDRIFGVGPVYTALSRAKDLTLCRITRFNVDRWNTNRPALRELRRMPGCS